MNKYRTLFLIGSTSLISAAGMVGAALPFVASWNPSARVLATSDPITNDISCLSSGILLRPMSACPLYNELKQRYG